MSEQNNRPTPDILDEATGALRDAPVPAGPPADLTAATVAAITNRLAGTVPSEPARRQKRRRIMRYWGLGTAAAVVAIATAAGVLLLGGTSAAARVQKALDNAAKAKSVRLVNKLDRDGKLETVMTMYVQTERSRWDINCTYPERNATSNRHQGQAGTHLNHKEKTAHRDGWEPPARRGQAARSVLQPLGVSAKSRI